MASKISITTNELLEAIRAAREPERSDAMTVREIMAALSLSRHQVRTLLTKVNARCIRVQRRDDTGRVQSLPAYVISKKKK